MNTRPSLRSSLAFLVAALAPLFLAVPAPAQNTTPAANTTVASAAPIPRTDAAGNPLRRAKTGHVSNYDESKVGNYTLPDPLVLNNGSPVSNATIWFDQRRPEILEAYNSQIYGRVPATAPKVHWEVTNPGVPALNGTAIYQTLTGHIGDDPSGPAIHLVMFLPAHATDPVPVFLHIVFFGVPPAPNAPPAPPALGPGGRPVRSISEAGPIPQILAHGYAYATFRYTDVQPDSATGSGVRQLALASNQTTFDPDAWGTISAWAWGISRVVDYLETDPAIDAHKIAIAGHSRLGKTVLWAGAQDQRIALVYSSCGGELGSALARRDFGETVDDMAQNFPWQFAGNLQQYAGHWDKMPVDTHMLISLIAPRPVFIVGGLGDLWSDPRGEFLGEVAAGPVYTLVGAKDLGTTRFPNVDTPIISGDLGYLYHSGAHTMPATDWFTALEFADQHFKAPPASAIPPSPSTSPASATPPTPAN